MKKKDLAAFCEDLTTNSFNSGQYTRIIEGLKLANGEFGRKPEEQEEESKPKPPILARPKPSVPVQTHLFVASSPIFVAATTE